MNNLNPLHIGALLLIIITFLFVKLDSTKTELKEVQESFKESERLAVDVSSLKSVYADKKKIKKSLDKIFNKIRRTTELKIKENKNSVFVSAKSIETSTLNALMGKILNGTYNVTELKIRKQSETKASVEMEIKW